MNLNFLFEILYLVVRENLGAKRLIYEVLLHYINQCLYHFQERLCFLFELKESRWKPQLRVMLHKLPNLTTVTLHDFCDDDTLSMVAHQCHHLANLTITLGISVGHGIFWIRMVNHSF